MPVCYQDSDNVGWCDIPGHITPSNGGCWYCHRVDDKLVFSMEFDTYIHIQCILDAMDHVSDGETIIFKEEFGL